MSEEHFPGPMSMVKIDGTKIKKLREQQGLTQLYLATAVEVTTDTISRWENRRYPSIKKENGLKLADALGVTLDEILEKSPDPVAENIPDDVPRQTPPTPNPTIPEPKRNKLSYSWPLLILSGTLMLIIAAFLYFYLKETSVVQISAERITPNHFVADQPFPVLITIKTDQNKPTAIIVKEFIPPGTKVISSAPSVTGELKNKKDLKWLVKIDGTSTFGYVLQSFQPHDERLLFKGTVAGSGDPEKGIIGSNTISSAPYHWADADKDNVISDREILSVYDLYSDLKGLDINIDWIEEMWLGSGYQWDPATKQFQIID